MTDKATCTDTLDVKEAAEERLWRPSVAEIVCTYVRTYVSIYLVNLISIHVVASILDNRGEQVIIRN